jgi:hypothetical protein
VTRLLKIAVEYERGGLIYSPVARVQQQDLWSIPRTALFMSARSRQIQKVSVDRVFEVYARRRTRKGEQAR